MSDKILISSAYLPPVEYFSLILKAEEILIEREENYHKQTFRNRCYLLTANSIQTLTVPVFLGSLHKTPLKNIRIDYSKRWQQIHLGAIIASYRSSPFFEFYFEDIESCILENHEFLIDLNTSLTLAIIKILGLIRTISFTSAFMPVGELENDFRYSLTPKKKSDFITKEYTQVFNHGSDFIAGLSIIDLVFNMGPESVNYL
jgi:hypothetical protein